MSKTKKILLGSTAVVILGVGSYIGVTYRDRGVVKVQSGKVQKMESLVQTVTASGEIKPLKYINITANSYGRIVEIPVKEGDRVKKGALLLKQESVQPSADLRSSEALLQQVMDDAEGQEAAVRSFEANLKTAQAEEVRTQADFERSRLDYERYQNLLKEGLVSKSQFDQVKATFEVANAQLDSARARVQQSRAQLNQAEKSRVSSRSRILQQRAAIAGVSDRVDKTIYSAPLDAVITNLPVRVGESAVPGIQNALGSGLMTLADLSIITAEVKVDETDIINVKLDQEAEVTVDAIPNKTFKGKVTEVGSSALTRTGQAAGSSNSSATSQEAKDFKVVVTLLDPTDQLKPGLSTTAKITTAVRSNVLAIPIQALTIREQEKETKKEPSTNPKTAQAATGKEAKANKTEEAATKSSGKKKEEQGVFLVKAGKAVFVPVKTGITGQTEIEVLSGLKEGDEIITGSYKTLRTIKTDTKVKVDNKSVGAEDQKNSK